MTSRLGAAFLVGAQGPLTYAGGLVMASKVPDALRELSPDNLFGGFQRGVAQVSLEAGIPQSDIERLLPMIEARMLMARLAVDQRVAIDAWGTYAGHLGGFMKGVTELTVDGRAPDVSVCVERLANKVVRDKPLYGPLRALSQDIQEWQDLIARCRTVLEDGGALSEAYKRRQRRRAAFGVSLAAVTLAMVGAALWVRAGRAHIDLTLAQADTCTVEDIGPADMGRASSVQRTTIASRKAMCEAGREATAKAKTEKDAREAAAREQYAKRKAREDACAAAARQAASGTLAREAASFSDEEIALLGRLAKRSLSATDLGPEAPKLACTDTPSGTRIAELFATAVLAAPTAWATADEPSPVVQAVLTKHRDELPAIAKQVAAKHAEDAAKRALLVDPQLTARAGELCKLKNAIGMRGGTYCASVLRAAAAATPVPVPTAAP